MLRLELIGHLGKDAVVNKAGGTDVINFNVAHSESFMKDGEKQEKTVWVDCSKWGEKTAVAQYLKKGTQVYVAGTPEVRTFTKADGTTGSALSCRVLEVQLLGGSKSNGEAQPQEKSAVTKPAAEKKGFVPVSTEGEEEEKLPF